MTVPILFYSSRIWRDLPAVVLPLLFLPIITREAGIRAETSRYLFIGSIVRKRIVHAFITLTVNEACPHDDDIAN